MDENVDYDERESEFDIEDEDRSVQLNEEEKLGDDIEVRNIFILDSIHFGISLESSLDCSSAPFPIPFK